MKLINPAVNELEPYEFRYALENLIPQQGWDLIKIDSKKEIINRVRDCEFFKNIQVKPKVDNQIVLDRQVMLLTQMLFVGLVKEVFQPEWIKQFFYFDVRGFYFLVRTIYFTDNVVKHLNDMPYKKFDQNQNKFESYQSIGYKEFKEANLSLDQFFIDCVTKLIEDKGTPIILAIAGPTAAGKTEIVTRLEKLFIQNGKKVSSVELDNFLTDRDYREERGIDSVGKEALHFQLLLQSLEDLVSGKRIYIPRYDFIKATSSHDLSGTLKSDCEPIAIEPADIVFIEGNSPFLIPGAAKFIGIKVVYLTDDPIRMKRKWKRDMDYRKKYDLNYFRNRYYKDQFLMAQQVFIPQMEICDIVVDTTGAAIWTTKEISRILDSKNPK
jgi:uridine kinase